MELKSPPTVSPALRLRKSYGVEIIGYDNDKSTTSKWKQRQPA